MLKRAWPALVVALALVIGAPLALAGDVLELLPGTAILLDQSSGSGSGGNTKSTSSSTNIFSPAAFVDYKRFGGEPTVVVDRYPYRTAGDCNPNPAPCYKDLVYQSPPQGFVYPRYSNIFKSDDLGQTFRVPVHLPGTAKALATGEGGGDSHLVVGALSHKLYFIDLALDCITMNVSADRGETFTTDELGCGANLLDDRQWVEADEAYPGAGAAGGWIYISAVNISTQALILTRSTGTEAGVVPGSFAAHSTCTAATAVVGSNPGNPSANDGVATPCPDPTDTYLWVAGPVVADKTVRTGNTDHPVYIPFVRRLSAGGLGLDCPCAWQLYVAKSTDAGASWKRFKVADLPKTVDPANIFVQMTIDRAGNLYYTWSQAQNVTEDSEGEQDIYYTFSTNGARSWAAPIDLTAEANDSAVFSWMVAGDPGRVDLVYYKSNSGVNSNVAPPDTIWNVYFAQSTNALNTSPNFKSVQVSAEPNHLGGLCTAGLNCSGDRDLLDFITVDVDHLGAAVIAYSDDHQRRNGDARDKSTRQISGVSVFKNQNISLQSSWPIHQHAVTDRAGDVYDGAGNAKGSCPGMDLLGESASRSGDRFTISLTLDSAPTAAKAIACSNGAATGGRWGAEFWAAAGTADGGEEGGNTFYVAYRDNPAEGPPGVEAGYIDNVNVTSTSLDFDPKPGVSGTLGGTCISNPSAKPCTLTMTISLSDLGITPGNGFFSITGLSTYFFGDADRAPLLVRLEGGNSEQADATAAFHYTGSGTP